MKRAILPLVLVVWAAGCGRSGEVVREGFLYDGRANALMFRQLSQVVHVVWESGGHQANVKRYREAWRVRFVGPQAPGAEDVVFTNRLTHDTTKVDYHGRSGRSKRFHVRLADTKGLAVDVGRNDVDYVILDDDKRELASGRFTIDVEETEGMLPDRTVFIEEPDYRFHFRYNYYHRPRRRRHYRRW